MMKKHLPALLLIFLVLFIYLSNLSRSVYGGDVGDLVTAASLMGVAHPPGYPLFTLIGFLLTRFSFLHLTQAYLVGIISATSGVIGLFSFYFLSYSLSKNKLASFLATITLAFSFLYWFYAEIAEVFALNSMFALNLLLVAIRYRQKPRLFLLGLWSFLLGLSFTNHQTILLIIPSLLLLIGKQVWKSLMQTKNTIAYIFIGIFLGLLPYLYIPFAAAKHPIINWDNVHDTKSFIHLILRQDYGTFQAGIFDQPTLWQRLITLKVYSLYLISQVTIPVFVISVLGFVILWKKDYILSLALAIAFILSGPFFIVYAGFPLTGTFILGVYERFFILSSLILFVPFATGIVWIVTFLSKLLSRSIYITIFQIVFFIIPLTLFTYNFPKTNLSSLMIGDTYVEDLLTSLPPHSLLVFNGDTLVFNTWYMHYVRHVRPDISLYNFGGQIQNKSSGTLSIAEGIKKTTDNKLDQLVLTLIAQSQSRPVFSSTLLEPTTDNKKITWVPYGLVYKLTLSSDSLPSKNEYLSQQKNIWASFHIPTKYDMEKNVYHNLTISEFPTAFSDAALVTGTFIYSHYKDSVAAEGYYHKAVEIAPENAKAYETIGTYDVGLGGRCPEIVDNLTKAIFYDPFEKIPYFLLYATYKDCFHKNDAAKFVADEFHNVFQEDFAKEFSKNIGDTLFSK